jgi:hypothetical protein
MALLDAKPFDSRPSQRRRKIVWTTLGVLVVLLAVWWNVRFWPEERAVDHFFQGIEANNFEGAYGLWMADPNWKQHAQKYSRYPYGQFYLDWGPAGEYGAIHSHKVLGASNPPEGSGSGVIVRVEINGRPVVERLWVEKKDKSLSFPP